MTAPAYFSSVQAQTSTLWDKLEADKVLAAPWFQLFKQVQSPRHVLSELLQNVEEHSGAATPGFAGLQFYKKTNHIQTVISDSGLGIVGTLMPVLSQRYPELAMKIGTLLDDNRKI